MTDVIKDFEEWYAKLPAPYKEDFMNTPALGEWAAKGFNAGHRACQSLNNKRIAELEATIRNMAAVIAKKDEALQISIEYQEEACQYFHDAMAGYKEHEHERYRDDLKETKSALALTADGVELVEVDPADYDAMYMLSEGIKLYTIKQKG